MLNRVSAGPCEHGNEPSGSILLALQEGLCFMELFSWSAGQLVT
jgi:hypothetical protein